MKKNNPILWTDKPGKLFNNVTNQRYAIVVLNSKRRHVRLNNLLYDF